MRKYPQLARLTVSAILALAVCCSVYAADKVLHIEVVNKFGKDLQEVYVVSGKSECGVGVLVAGKRKVYGYYNKPMQTNAFVQFDSQGKKHKFEVSLIAPYSSEKRDGTLVFVIQSTNAVVSVVPDED